MQPRLDCADFRIHRLRDLFKRQFLVLRQNQRLALEWRQRPHSLSYNLSDFASLDVHRRRDETLIVQFLPLMLVAPSFEHDMTRDAEKK